MAYTVVLRKRVIGYAYPRSGNVGNPTERVIWEAWRDGRQTGSFAPLLRVLREEYPDAGVGPHAPGCLCCAAVPARPCSECNGRPIEDPRGLLGTTTCGACAGRGWCL